MENIYEIYIIVTALENYANDLLIVQRFIESRIQFCLIVHVGKHRRE